MITITGQSLEKNDIITARVWTETRKTNTEVRNQSNYHSKLITTTKILKIFCKS